MIGEKMPIVIEIKDEDDESVYGLKYIGLKEHHRGSDINDFLIFNDDDFLKANEICDKLNSGDFDFKVYTDRYYSSTRRRREPSFNLVKKDKSFGDIAPVQDISELTINEEDPDYERERRENRARKRPGRKVPKRKAKKKERYGKVYSANVNAKDKLIFYVRGFLRYYDNYDYMRNKGKRFILATHLEDNMTIYHKDVRRSSPKSKVSSFLVTDKVYCEFSDTGQLKKLRFVLEYHYSSYEYNSKSQLLRFVIEDGDKSLNSSSRKIISTKIRTDGTISPQFIDRAYEKIEHFFDH